MNRKFIGRVKFKKNNIIYGQDFSTYQGIPENVILDVHVLNEEKLILKGYGYGDLESKTGDAYGNGSMYISVKNYKKALKDKIVVKVKKTEKIPSQPNPKPVCPHCGKVI